MMRRVAVLGLCLLLFTLGIGQVPPSGPIPMAQEMALSLASGADAAKLQLGDAQLAQVRQILDEFRKERDQFAGDTRYASELPNRSRFFAGQVLRTLNDAQVVMLRRLGAQRMGPIALLRPDVGPLIGLNSAQATQIKGLYDAYMQRVERISANLAKELAQVAPPQNPKNPDQVRAYRQRQERVRARMQPVLEEVAMSRVSVDEAALMRLRPEQRQRWQTFIDVR